MQAFFKKGIFTTVQLEHFVPHDYPLRAVRDLFNRALKRINGLLDGAYSAFGKDSIPPERQLRTQLLQVLYNIRSVRQLVEQINDNLLFRYKKSKGSEEKLAYLGHTLMENRNGLIVDVRLSIADGHGGVTRRWPC